MQPPGEGNCPPRAPPLPRRSLIPVPMGPLRKGCRPLRNPDYRPPRAALQSAPYRLQSVPGRAGRLQRMLPTTFQDHMDRMYPYDPNLSMEEMLNMSVDTTPRFRIRRSSTGSPTIQWPGGRATGFENLLGEAGYGEGWTSMDFETCGAIENDPNLFDITSEIPNEYIEGGFECIQGGGAPRGIYTPNYVAPRQRNYEPEVEVDEDDLEWASAQNFLEQDLAWALDDDICAEEDIEVGQDALELIEAEEAEEAEEDCDNEESLDEEDSLAEDLHCGPFGLSPIPEYSCEDLNDVD
ncbi:hypothetical protein GE061_006987 [Apolygus lucorum]|uniref:Uncharacterized protein n=1 Tax=Apolygus lucorum TaxID=248454 RepID=A0A8S9WRV1_APOLU|nr:hypothetical protein GE061_006987 [Apolygus lucorum]